MRKERLHFAVQPGTSAARPAVSRKFLQPKQSCVYHHLVIYNLLLSKYLNQCSSQVSQWSETERSLLRSTSEEPQSAHRSIVCVARRKIALRAFLVFSSLSAKNSTNGASHIASYINDRRHDDHSSLFFTCHRLHFWSTLVTGR